MCLTVHAAPEGAPRASKRWRVRATGSMVPEGKNTVRSRIPAFQQPAARNPALPQSSKNSAPGMESRPSKKAARWASKPGPRAQGHESKAQGHHDRGHCTGRQDSCRAARPHHAPDCQGELRSPPAAALCWPGAKQWHPSRPPPTAKASCGRLRPFAGQAPSSGTTRTRSGPRGGQRTAGPGTAH